jgi:hypothetical protein
VNWKILSSVSITWLGIWVLFIAYRSAKLSPDSQIRQLGCVLPPFTVLTCLAFFFLAPTRDSATHRIVLLVHHASIMALFGFLVVAEFLQLEAFFQIRMRMSARSIVLNFRRLWVLTEIVPGSVAPIILLSGLYLIWENPSANSPSRIWLLAILIAFGLFFVDGLVGYAPIVRAWYREWDQLAANASSEEMGRFKFFQGAQLLAHCLSWPILFLLGISRFDRQGALSRVIAGVLQELAFLPRGWPAVAVAVGVFVASGTVVLIARGIACLAVTQFRFPPTRSIRSKH